MSFTIRGVIEGFYDRLWTWPERERVLRRTAEMGFNVYAYAPKEDRLQNAGWRTPYPDEQRRRLADFARLCRDLGVEPWMALRPVGISYADESDVGLVIAKLRDYVELGAQRLVLLADDIPSQLEPPVAGIFTGLANAHAWLIAELRQAIPSVPLTFCPTDYHGGGTDYLRSVAAAIPAEVELFWTGPDVCSSQISGEAAGEIGAVLGRPPLVWDNYPVNDAQMKDELHIGPIRDRDPDLHRYVAGILVNPAMEPEASLVPLATWADYLRDPESYDPDAAWQRALLDVCGNAADAQAVAALAVARDRSVIRQPWRLPPRAALDPIAQRAASVSSDRLAEDLCRFVHSPA